MLPTPSTSHLAFTHIYEPAEDSYLLLDTISSAYEAEFLRKQFPEGTSPPPLVLEVGTGSGVVLSFLTANASAIIGRGDVVALGTDINKYACRGTAETMRIELQRVQKAVAEANTASIAVPDPLTALSPGLFLAALNMDLFSALRPSLVDVLVFNPPYVPTPQAPTLPHPNFDVGISTFEVESRYLELAYAGGPTGMATTDRLLHGLDGVLSERGVLYLLLCAQNKPEEVAERLRRGYYGGSDGSEGDAQGGGVRWKVEKVGSSGRKSGWEVLSIWRVWR
ncbi:hypothetical protein BDZ91DRAFT_694066 [Kalaharituber pfeilii]|nr:hypothetical protein BDZ91DRAFT_694066 [Kalaharituber pfeilii]